MEFSERKRSRKSQSFKLVSRDYHHEVYKVSEFSNDVNGEAKETQPIFLARVQEDKRTVIKARDKLSKSPGRRTLDIQRDKRPNVSLKVRLVYF